MYAPSSLSHQSGATGTWATPPPPSPRETPTDARLRGVPYARRSRARPGGVDDERTVADAALDDVAEARSGSTTWGASKTRGVRNRGATCGGGFTTTSLVLRVLVFVSNRFEAFTRSET